MHVNTVVIVGRKREGERDSESGSIRGECAAPSGSVRSVSSAKSTGHARENIRSDLLTDSRFVDNCGSSIMRVLRARVSDVQRCD